MWLQFTYLGDLCYYKFGFKFHVLSVFVIKQLQTRRPMHDPAMFQASLASVCPVRSHSQYTLSSISTCHTIIVLKLQQRNSYYYAAVL